MKYIFCILICFTFFSCKKEVSSVGYDMVNSESPYVGAIDTFSINTSTIVDDTVATSYPGYLLLGDLNDPRLGKTTASFYSQLRLISTNPNFGDLSKLTVDSVILSMRYDDNYGVLEPMIFSVKRLTQNLDSTIRYTSRSILTDDGVELCESQTAILPRTIGSYFVNNFGDTIWDQITLKLKNDLGLQLINQTVSSPTTYSSIYNFNNWFKGLTVSCKSNISQQGSGAVLYIATSPVLTIYYTIDGVAKKYYYELNQNAVRFNHIDFLTSGSDLESSIKTLDYSYYYSQANNCRAFIKIPYLSAISSNSVVHSAKLVLPFDVEDTYKYPPGLQVNVAVPNSSTDKRLRLISTGVIDTVNKTFVIDLRGHVQSIITGKRLNLGLYVSVGNFSTTADRIRFTNLIGNRPKLYTKISSFKQ